MRQISLTDRVMVVGFLMVIGYLGGLYVHHVPSSFFSWQLQNPPRLPFILTTGPDGWHS
jgi:hypothetical protein